MNWHHQQT